MSNVRDDGVAEWYEGFRPALKPDELDALHRLLGTGDGRCLDVGCGTGLSTAAVAELGWSAVGVDLSEDMLEVARGRGLEVVQGSADGLPFEDETFDAAVSVWTHTDIEDFSSVLKETARVLRPQAPWSTSAPIHASSGHTRCSSAPKAFPSCTGATVLRGAMTVPLPASPIPTGSVRVSTARIFRSMAS